MAIIDIRDHGANFGSGTAAVDNAAWNAALAATPTGGTLWVSWASGKDHPKLTMPVATKSSITIKIDSGIEFEPANSTTGGFFAVNNRQNLIVIVGDATRNYDGHPDKQGKWGLNIDPAATAATPNTKCAHFGGTTGTTWQRITFEGGYVWGNQETTSTGGATSNTSNTAAFTYNGSSNTVPTEVVLRNMTSLNYPAGYGLTQVQSGDDLGFYQCMGDGGTTLRLEQDAAETTTNRLRRLIADAIGCRRGNRAVAIVPHGHENTGFKITRVTADRCYEGIFIASLSPGPVNGTIDKVWIEGGAGAQYLIGRDSSNVLWERQTSRIPIAGSSASVPTTNVVVRGSFQAGNQGYPTNPWDPFDGFDGSDPTPTGSAPIVTGVPATNIGISTATVGANITASGTAGLAGTASYYAEYGTTTGYGSVSGTASTSGTAAVAVTRSLTGLTASTLYHWRMVGVNANGTTRSGDRTFTTAAATANLGTSQSIPPKTWPGVSTELLGGWSRWASQQAIPMPGISGLEDGDLLVYAAAAEGTGAHTAAAGFTALRSGTASTTLKGQLYYRVWSGTAAMPATFDFALGSSTGGAASLTAWRGVDVTDVPNIIHSEGAGTTAAPTSGTITPGDDAGGVLYMIGARSTASLDFGSTSSAGVTQLYFTDDQVEVTAMGTAWTNANQSAAIPNPLGNFQNRGTMKAVPSTGTPRSPVTNSAASTSFQSVQHAKFVSPVLGVSTINAQDWQFALNGREANAAANAFWNFSLFVLKSDGTVRDYIVDANTNRGTELGTTSPAASQIITVAGSQVTSVAPTDRLCIEIYTRQTQSNATSYAIRGCNYNGQDEPVDGVATDSPASYVKALSQDIFSGALDASPWEELYEIDHDGAQDHKLAAAFLAMPTAAASGPMPAVLGGSAPWVTFALALEPATDTPGTPHPVSCTVELDEDNAKVNLFINTDADNITVIRTHPSGKDVVVRGAEHKDASAGEVVVYDYEVPVRRLVSYTVVAYDNLNAEVGRTDPVQVFYDTDEEWLGDPLLPARNMPVTVEGITEEYDAGASVIHVQKRPAPVVVSDTVSSASGVLSLLTFDQDDFNRLNLLKASGHVLLLRSNPESNVGSMYIAFTGRVSANRIGTLRDAPERRWSCEYVEVDPPSGELSGGFVTWADVSTGYSTWEDVLDGEENWLDLVEGVNALDPEDRFEEVLAWRGA